MRVTSGGQMVRGTERRRSGVLTPPRHASSAAKAPTSARAISEPPTLLCGGESKSIVLPEDPTTPASDATTAARDLRSHSGTSGRFDSDAGLSWKWRDQIHQATQSASGT